MDAPLRILANLALPQPPGFILKHFGHYLPPPTGSTLFHAGMQETGTWQAQNERRSLKEILARIPAAERPDILLIRSPEYLPLPLDLATFPGLKILLLTDWNIGLRFLIPLCRLFDVGFTDAVGARLLQNAGASNVKAAAMYGHDSKTIRDQLKQRDLHMSFCGNLNAAIHRERNRILVKLLPLQDKFRIHLTPAFGPAYVDILSRSQLIFNHSIRGEANMRLYEAMACGAVPLVEKNNVEVPQLFREGQEYVTYNPDNPVPDIAALLQEPERLAQIGQRAKAAVANHSADKQLAAMLNTAVSLAGSAGSFRGYSANEILISNQSLQKLRVLGSGYTLREAIDEIQAAAGQDPALRLETFPGLLLSLLEREKSHADRLPVLLRWIEQFLADPKMPPLIGAIHRLQLAVAGNQPESIVAAADHLIDQVGLQSETMPLSIYRHFLAPIDLGKPLNSDINTAYRARLETGNDHAFLDLLRHWGQGQKALALKRREYWQRSIECLQESPGNGFLSIMPYSVLSECALRLGHSQAVVKACEAWHAENPLDIRVWEETVTRLKEAGEMTYLASYLGHLCFLAQAFLRDGVPPALATLAEEYGAVRKRVSDV